MRDSIMGKIESIIKKYLEPDEEDNKIEYPDKRDVDLIRRKIKGNGIQRGMGGGSP